MDARAAGIYMSTMPITAELVRAVFGLDVQILLDPQAGTPIVVPVGRARMPAAPPAARPPGSPHGRAETP
jgi:hypothetical protein